MLCAHVEPGARPFATLFVIEDYLGLASGLVACRTCGTTWLLELIDLSGGSRAFRVASVEPGHAAAMIRTLTRGTCDINRARGEIENLETRSPLQPVVLTMAADVVLGVQAVPLAEVPRAHWLALPCDGQWLASDGYVRTRGSEERP